MITHDVPEWRSVRRDWLLKAMGHTDASISRPLIAVVNSWSEMNPGHYHLRELAAAVKRGILMAGGTPLEFNTASICDGFVVEKRYVLPFRDLIACSTEMMLRSNSFSGAVFLTTCDKNVPAHLMAAARVNLPSIFVTGGPMLPGHFEGKDVVCCTDGRPMIGRYIAGDITPEQFQQFSQVSHGSVGACGMMGTANTMQCLVEGLGMSLTGCATTHAVAPAKYRYAEESGRTVMKLVEANLGPRDIMNGKTMNNAIRLLMALGGSTNGILHLLAISRDAGIGLDLETFERISAETPCLCNVKPSGTYTMLDFDRAGGVPAVMKHLEDLLELDVLTVSGQSLREILQQVSPFESDVVRSPQAPLSPHGGIAVLKGNISPDGGVVKQTAFPRNRLKHRGNARVFQAVKEVEQGLRTGSLTLHPEDVLVLQNQGPKGAPGMPEIHIPPIFYANGLADMLILTDGRTSGSTRGPMVLHIAPEAAAGGPIGIIRDGDEISIDVENGRLDLLISSQEYEQRLASHRRSPPVEASMQMGWMGLYRMLVGCASRGALVRPLQ